MRFLSALLLFALAASPAALTTVAQIPNLVTPEFLIPSASDIPRSKLSKWTDAAGRVHLTLQTADGLLRGYRYAGKDANAPTILFFNGNGQMLEENDSFYRQLTQLGPTVVVYDYLGYGVSAGTADVLKFPEDGLKIYDQTVTSAAQHKVIVYGYSLGTAVAVYVASKRPVAALILAAPIATGQEQFHFAAEQANESPTQIQLLRVDPYVQTLLDEVGMIKQSRAPLLVIHGTSDKTVSYAEGREVFAASPSPQKYFVKIEGADHMGLPVQMGAYESIKRFLPLVEKQ
jgi:pimeloyl-ACP methyl ester carboxylesterase